MRILPLARIYGNGFSVFVQQKPKLRRIEIDRPMFKSIQEIVIQGHGQTVRSYLYGADLAIWLFTILLRGEHARPYNLGSDIPITIAQLAEFTAKACGSHAGIRILGHLQPDETAEVYLPDINRARTELGLGVLIPFEESLKRTALYHSPINNP